MKYCSSHYCTLTRAWSNLRYFLKRKIIVKSFVFFFLNNPVSSLMNLADLIKEEPTGHFHSEISWCTVDTVILI